MSNEIVTKDNERIKAFFRSLDKMLDKIEMSLTSCKPTLNGERFLTDSEVAERLKIHKRTLHVYRNEGKISYLQIGGKILYRESDIQKLLDESYSKAWE